MRKLLSLIGLMIVAIPSNSQDIAVRLGGNYGINLKQAGITLGGEYFLKNNLTLGADINYFVPKVRVNPDGNSVQRLDYQLNLRYYYPLKEKNLFYALGGIGLAKERNSRGGLNETYTSKSSDASVNAGLGYLYKLSTVINPFAEIKYSFGPKRIGVLAVGIFIRDTWRKQD